MNAFAYDTAYGDWDDVDGVDSRGYPNPPTDRNYLEEALAILDGKSLMLPQREHLQALAKFKEVA